MFYFLFQLREMEKKLSEGKGGDPALPSPLDGTYCVNKSLDEYELDQCLSNAFLDDMSIRDGRRVKSSFTSRLYKSFRDRYSVKSKLNKSFHDMAAKRQFETSFLDSTVLFNSTVADPHDISVLRSHRASWHHYKFNKSSHQSSTESRV